MDYKKSLTCLALSMAALSVSAQSQTVTGKIVDNDGLEVIGASVSLKGEKGVGAVSDINGNFTIKCTRYLISWYEDSRSEGWWQEAT